MPGKDQRAASGRATGATGPTAAGATGTGAAEDARRASRDHAAISRLADELLPALIARLAASGLGEIEVREGEWKARLRKPAGVGEKSHSGHSPAARPPAKAVDEPGQSAKEEEPPSNLPIMATSPAVGVFSPRKEAPAGQRVRAGDRIGFVDVLGVREDVLAPIDGIVGVFLVEAGEAVEYGQELIKIELPDTVRGHATDREAAAVLGEA